jgi:hypothetical protein
MGLDRYNPSMATDLERSTKAVAIIVELVKNVRPEFLPHI